MAQAGVWGVAGLSPRVRGNRDVLSDAITAGGSIPARAGEPKAIITYTDAQEVYPRACGGTAPGWVGDVLGEGLSPRVRGNQRVDVLSMMLEGSIPARAGEPLIGVHL